MPPWCKLRGRRAAAPRTATGRNLRSKAGGGGGRKPPPSGAMRPAAERTQPLPKKQGCSSRLAPRRPPQENRRGDNDDGSLKPQLTPKHQLNNHKKTPAEHKARRGGATQMAQASGL